MAPAVVVTAELREVLNSTDWASLHAEGKTNFCVESSWIASEERCELLRRLCTKYSVSRVLEVGAGCGLASLSMAEVLPVGGELVALEIDPFLADFGRAFMKKSNHGAKISYMVGPAMESLRVLARQCFEGRTKPFDLLLVDADRAGLMDYFNLFWWESPNLLGEGATVCFDVTPYKGQAPVLTRGPSTGDFQGGVLVVPSGQDQIDSLRRTLEASVEHQVYTVAGLLVSHSRGSKEDADSESRVSTPRRAESGAWKPRGSLSHAANPFASFPNDHFKSAAGAQWVRPHVADPEAQLRAKVREANWTQLYADGMTKTHVEAQWCGTRERCEMLRYLIAATQAKNVLEVGGFCGVSALSMAAALPDNGQVTSLEVDPFLVAFGQEVRAGSSLGQKVCCLIGDAKGSLDNLSRKAKEADCEPFDFVVIDADRASMCEYFLTVWKSPNLLAREATVCIDITPFKGQKPVPCKRRQAATEEQAEWIIPSGQSEVDALCALVESSPDLDVHKVAGLLIIKKKSAF